MPKKRPRGIKSPGPPVDMEDVDPITPEEELKRRNPHMRFLTKEESLARLRKDRERVDDRSSRARRAAATRAKNKLEVDPDKVRTCVSIRPEDKGYLRWLGKGNLSKGIRIAARLAQITVNPQPDLEEREIDERLHELRGELRRKALRPGQSSE